MIAMKKRSPIEQQLNDARVSLLRSDMQRRHSLAVAFVDNESALLAVEQLFDGIEASIACCEVQRRLIVVILEVDACAKSN